MIGKRYILRRIDGDGYFTGLKDVILEDGSCASEAMFSPERKEAYKFLDAGRASGVAVWAGCNVIEITNPEDLEPMEPEMEGAGYSWFYVCGDCHGAIDYRAEKCRHCGRPVRWEGF